MLRPSRIVHIGIGNFARAHQAWYTLHADPAGEWGITAFTGRGPAMAQALQRQGGLYALIVRGASEDRIEVIDTLTDVRPAADLDGLVAAIAAPQTAVVTLTVTEAGYASSPAGEDAPAVDRPLPPTPPQRLAAGLAARHGAGAGPLAIVSCDNVHANGAVLRELTLSAAQRLAQPGLTDWIGREVAFVSTSVDRITPRSTDADRQLVARELDRDDAVPVVTEPFTDWVLCGEFPAGRPRWEDAGARFAKEIEPWELRKLWLLNGGHCLLAYMGLLRGHVSVADAAADPQLDAALDGFWDLAARHLPAGELDIPNYRRALKQRFANPRIGYPLTQIAGDGLGKLRNRVVPVVRAALAAGESAAPATRILAAWWRWLIEDPERAASDQSAAQLRGALAAATDREGQARALQTLLAPELQDLNIEDCEEHR